MKTMSDDAKAILLLCGHLGGESSVDSLNQHEYNQVVRWLLGRNLRPADLLSPENVSELAQATGLEGARLAALLQRGVKLGFAVEQWNQSGVWVICRSDLEYPARYKTHLKDKAPPILFGAGERSLLQGGGLAIVGSRNVDTMGENFTRDVAERCAREGMPVVSGAARGVDQIAMSSALAAGGIVLGVLADTLLRRSVSRDAREALAEGRLLLVSPYHPEAGFSVGNAMGRNKLIYALADFGLVVSAEYKKGGTWEGAAEELKREQGRPVFVRIGAEVPAGNLELAKMGGKVFPAPAAGGGIREALNEAARTKLPPMTLELPLATASEWSGTVGIDYGKPRESEPMIVEEPPPAQTRQLQPQPATILEAVRPVILRALEQAKTVDDLAAALNVRKPQTQDWVRALLAEGVLIEQRTRKARKVVVRKPEEELRLR